MPSPKAGSARDSDAATRRRVRLAGEIHKRQARGESSRTAGTGVAIKGGRNGLRLVLPADGEFAAICRDLRAKLAQSGSFFAGAGIAIDESRRPLAPEETAALARILRRTGLIVQREPVTRENAEMRQVDSALTVRSPVRSGQKISFEGSIIVLGDVHAGAEVSAGRDVIVMGSARGAISAGQSSGRDARVFAFDLRPSLLRLGDLAARSPGTGAAWRAEIARVRDGRIVVEPFKGWRDKPKTREKT